jgi:two-component system, cell cycle sensor histidine kinase and response regulator CckA
MQRVLIFSTGDISQLNATCIGAPAVQRVHAQDESSAVLQAREHQPRLTIVDAQTPGAVGLIRRLRLDPRTRDTGIVALSASSDLSDEIDLRKAGANLVLARPFDAARWDAPIRRLLDVPPRRAGRIQATFEVWDGPGASHRRLKGTALNISLNGILLECRRVLPIGTKLDVVLSLPAGEVRALAEVVRDAGGRRTGHRAGLQFLVLRGEAAPRINLFVSGDETARPKPATSVPAESAQWEAELRAGEARLRGVLDSAPDAVVLFDHNGRACEINRAAEVLFGCSRSDVLGRPALDRFVPGPLQQIFRCALAHQFVAAEHLLGRRIEAESRRGDGSPFTAELTFTRFSAKGCGFWALFARDVTERRRLTDELQANQHRFRTLVENSADGIALLERDGRFRYLTASAANLLGYAPADLVGRTADELVLPEHVTDARQILRRSLETPGVPVSGELPCRHRDGSPRAIELIVVNHLDTVEVGAIVINYRDVTHRHRAQQLEEELRQSQKIEALGRLAGGVAHDFNNLLGVILGASRLAVTEGGDATRRLDQVQRAAEKAATLTHQLLAFSRKQVLMPQVLEVGSILRELDGMLERLVGEEIKLTTIVSPGLARVRADRSQLEQAIMNLVVNARDAMPDGGRLTVEAKNVDLDADFVSRHAGSRGGQFLQLSVTDTGIGMDAETQRRVFEPFFTTKERGKGTGLGLATTYGIVKQSGGYIAVQSIPGGGSRFDIFLPRVEDAPTRSAEPVRVKSNGGGETILLVEDDSMLRRVAAEILHASGYPVLEAANGEEALSLSRAHVGPLPLLVADIVMPGMSGRQLAERLLRERLETRVLYISGYTDDEILRHGIVEGTVDLLEKPFSPEALSTAVRRLLDRAPRQDAAAAS